MYCPKVKKNRFWISELLPLCAMTAMIILLLSCKFSRDSSPSSHQVASRMSIGSHGPKNPALLSMSHPGWLIGILIMVYYNPHING